MSEQSLEEAWWALLPALHAHAEEYAVNESEEAEMRTAAEAFARAFGLAVVEAAAAWVVEEDMERGVTLDSLDMFSLRQRIERLSRP